MNLQRILGGIIAIAGAWILWGGYHAVDVIVSRGSSLSDALMQPPTSLIRLVSAIVIVLGGLAILAGMKAGRWVTLIGVLLFALLPVLMATMGADPVLWADEAVTAGILIVLFAGLLVAKRS